MTFTFGSLFSGIGGIDLGLEWAGMQCRFQVEIDPYCTRVLAKHWPDVARYSDIRELSGEELEHVDLICGGFPCQDVSLAGNRAGLAGERSGLWFEFARLIRVLRPRYVLVENVPGLLSSGMGQVLGDLAGLGYDVEWESLPAAAFGAPHIRERVFIVAHARCAERREGHPERRRNGRQHNTDGGGTEGAIGACQCRKDVAHANSSRQREVEQHLLQRQPHATGCCETVADATEHGRQPRRAGNSPEEPRGRQLDRGSVGADVSHANEQGLEIRQGVFGNTGEKQSSVVRSDWWAVEPAVGRVAHGIPGRVDRLKGLGNSVVPQVAEWVGRRILEADET